MFRISLQCLLFCFLFPFRREKASRKHIPNVSTSKVFVMVFCLFYILLSFYFQYLIFLYIFFVAWSWKETLLWFIVENILSLVTFFMCSFYKKPCFLANLEGSDFKNFLGCQSQPWWALLINSKSKNLKVFKSLNLATMKMAHISYKEFQTHDYMWLKDLIRTSSSVFGQGSI